MKNTSYARLSSREHGQTTRQQPSAGTNGIAIYPPGYGINPTDSQQIAGEPVQLRKDAGGLEGMTGEFHNVFQRKPLNGTANPASLSSPAPNRTGLPDALKAGVENLSGMAMDDVRVHRNSDKPAQLNAHAYTQGTEIHVAPGQEKHLPHEAWHVVQQKQGRVPPTVQMAGGVAVNDDAGLEAEADVMGNKAFQFVDNRPASVQLRKLQKEGKTL